MDVASLVEVTKNPRIPDIAPGDTVKVSARIVEAGKERIQVFQGVVLKIRRGGTGTSFTVRHVAYGIGVERTFPFYSPLVEKVEIVRQGKVRRSRLYYLRGLSGKAARRKIKRVERKVRVVGEEPAETAQMAEEVMEPEAEIAEEVAAVETPEAEVAEEVAAIETPEAEVAEEVTAVETPAAEVAEEAAAVETPAAEVAEETPAATEPVEEAPVAQAPEEAAAEEKVAEAPEAPVAEAPETPAAEEKPEETPTMEAETAAPPAEEPTEEKQND